VRCQRVADRSFDLAHSNSVIEHVGGWENMAAMAREICRIAPFYFDQTPNFWFPVEPHCSTLLFRWVPVPARVSMLMRRPRGNRGKASDLRPPCARSKATTCSASMLAPLFRDATLRSEKFLGITKSLIAIVTPPFRATKAA
jgi:hypothetical protein